MWHGRVHTNMCVLGRPFGLRQLASHGKQVALIRDMTDTMYDPRCWPFVIHFSGTDLIVDHIERLVCPTFTSDDISRWSWSALRATCARVWPFSVPKTNTKPRKTLPEIAAVHLGGYRLHFIFGDANDKGSLPGIEQIATDDALLVSVRRRPLKPEQLQIIRSFICAGKPVIGNRTASHAFSLRNKQPEAGWPIGLRSIATCGAAAIPIIMETRTTRR